MPLKVYASAQWLLGHFSLLCPCFAAAFATCLQALLRLLPLLLVLLPRCDV